MTTHISYKCAKALKEFLGDSAPVPLDHEAMHFDHGNGGWPYQLHDLLSKPFCKVMAKKAEGYTGVSSFYADWEMSNRLSYLYFTAGLPAVEKELMALMEAR